MRKQARVLDGEACVGGGWGRSACIYTTTNIYTWGRTYATGFRFHPPQSQTFHAVCIPSHTGVDGHTNATTRITASTLTMRLPGRLERDTQVGTGLAYCCSYPMSCLHHTPHPYHACRIPPAFGSAPTPPNMTPNPHLSVPTPTGRRPRLPRAHVRPQHRAHARRPLPRHHHRTRPGREHGLFGACLFLPLSLVHI